MLFIIVKSISEGSEGKSTFKVSSIEEFGKDFLLYTCTSGRSSDRLELEQVVP